MHQIHDAVPRLWLTYLGCWCRSDRTTDVAAAAMHTDLVVYSRVHSAGALELSLLRAPLVPTNMNRQGSSRLKTLAAVLAFVHENGGRVARPRCYKWLLADARVADSLTSYS